jgi:hypothetical protein
MSYNPYIQRILIEQIQEFDELDLQDIDPNDPNLVNKLVLIAYNIHNRKFFVFQYDMTNGNITINNNAFLEQNHEVNTDNLSTPRGFIFQSGWTLDKVVDALCNPPIPPVLTLTLDKYLIEVNVASNINLSYILENAIEDTSFPPTYKRGILTIPSSTDQFTPTIPGITEYSVTIRTEVSTSYPAINITATDNVKAVFPFLIDAGPNNTLTSIGTLDPLQVQPLHDINATGYLIADFPSIISGGQPTPQNYYWFAIQKDLVPVEWVAIDANNIESALNRGPIATGFTDIGNLTFRGNSFKIWMGIQPTFYSDKIMIKF